MWARRRVDIVVTFVPWQEQVAMPAWVDGMLVHFQNPHTLPSQNFIGVMVGDCEGITGTHGIAPGSPNQRTLWSANEAGRSIWWSVGSDSGCRTDTVWTTRCVEHL